MNDDLELSPEIIEGAKIIRLGQSLIQLKNAMEHAEIRAGESITNAGALDRAEIVTEIQSLLINIKSIREKLKNPQIQEWTAAEEEIPF
ncbi:hypothetical protein [Acaryochloris marina]|uniref:hypothetical protein n=1 Tax=Acaryochloris marina TaxID=155978 RepID=UPI001BAEC7DC|nr:hypothetical protein [Acaryochloris marina]QUY45527.1 hypothetical protein I1H34_27620 [Acaryochloris marina S15]